MPEIKFERNKFQTFRATTNFHLGEKALNVIQDSEVEYDGETVKYRGMTFPSASLRGAIRVGLLVPVEDNVSRYIPRSAGVQVRPATAAGRERGAPLKMENAHDDEREVGTVGDQREKLKASIMETPAPKPMARQAAKAKIPVEMENEPEIQLGDNDVGEEDVGEVVQSVQRTPPAAKVKTLITENTPVEDLSEEVIEDAIPQEEAEIPQEEEVGSHRPRSVEEAERINKAILARTLAAQVPKPKDPRAYGGTRYDSVSDEPSKTKGGKKFAYKASEDDQGGQVVRKLKTNLQGAAVGAEGEATKVAKSDLTKVNAQSIEAAQKPIGGSKRPELPKNVIQKVAAKAPAQAAPLPRAKTGAVVVPEKARTVEAEMVLPQGTATQVTEGESLSAKVNGTTGDVQETRMGSDLTELLPDAEVAGGKPPAVIRGQDTEGFSWDQSLHWTKRVDLAVKNYGSNPEALQHILGVETPSVVKQIQSRLIRSGKAVG